MGERVSQSEAARRLGVTRQAINGKIRRGTLATADGLVDLDEAEGALAPAGAADGATQPPEEVASYRKARARREHFAALEGELRYKEQAGKLVNVDEVAHGITTAAASLRLTLEALPDRLADRLAAEADPAAVHTMMTAAIDEALDDFRASLRLTVPAET